jgi:hypothetical protein
MKPDNQHAMACMVLIPAKFICEIREQNGSRFLIAETASVFIF